MEKQDSRFEIRQRNSEQIPRFFSSRFSYLVSPISPSVRAFANETALFKRVLFLAKIGMRDELGFWKFLKMTTMNISLPDKMKAFIEAQMARDGFASASEYLRTLIRDAQKSRVKQELEIKFREALESGPATLMTKKDWVALRQEAMEGLTGESICP